MVPQPLCRNTLPCCGQCCFHHPLAIKLLCLFFAQVCQHPPPLPTGIIWDVPKIGFRRTCHGNEKVLQPALVNLLAWLDPLPSPPALRGVLKTLLPLWEVCGVKMGCVLQNHCSLPPKCPGQTRMFGCYYQAMVSPVTTQEHLLDSVSSTLGHEAT